MIYVRRYTLKGEQIRNLDYYQSCGGYVAKIPKGCSDDHRVPDEHFIWLPDLRKLSTYTPGLTYHFYVDIDTDEPPVEEPYDQPPTRF